MIKIIDIIKSDKATYTYEADLLYKSIMDRKGEGILISFEGMSKVSSSFLMYSLGKAIYKNEVDPGKIKFIYPKDSKIFKLKVDNVIENALLGSKYDKIVEYALKK